MDTNQKHLFRQHSDNEANHFSAERKSEDQQEEPEIPIPDEPTIPELPDQNPGTTRPELGINEPGKNDPTRIDEDPPIFNNY